MSDAEDEMSRETRRSARMGRWSAVAAIAGGLAWMAVPWVQTAVLGDRPYVATGFDVLSFVGWVAMAAGLLGFRSAFVGRDRRLGRLGVGLTGFGMTLVAGLLLRSVIRFVRAGFRAVPATGEDPAGLLVTLATVVGLGATLLGVGLIGVALLRRDGAHPVAVALLLSAPAVPIALVAFRLASLLPAPIGRVVVTTNAALLPLGVAWVALGALVWTRSSGDRD